MWVDLPTENWRLFLRSLVPSDVGMEEHRRRLQEYEACINVEDWNIRTRANRPSDIEEELTALKIPLLVTHPREWLTLPIEEPMAVAAAAPNGRLVLIEGVTATGDPGQMLAAIDSFIADLPAEAEDAELQASNAEIPERLSARELEVLRLVAAGKSNDEIAGELVISRNTVRRHVSHIFDKTGVANRAQAGADARDHGLT
jgi:DNA-binding CsgD family transcriptional regulator